MKLYEYSSDELDEARSLLTKISLKNATSSQNPTATLLGGQPAAGKTRLIRYLLAQGKNQVVINGDEYRQYHPRFQHIQAEYGQNAPHHTQPFSNALVEFMKEECLQRRLNFIIEGTMRTYRVIESTAKQASQQGFQTEAYVLAVHSDDSYLGIFQRYEGEMSLYGSGRFSPIATHDEAYRQIPVNVQQACQEQIFRKIAICCRSQNELVQVVYNVEKAGSDNIPDFQSLFNQLRQPLRTASFYQEEWHKIDDKTRGRGETDLNYLAQISDFCNRYV